MFLNRLKIQNVKSLEDIDIEPKKITIFIGPNSSGKSTVLQTLGIVKQSLIENNGRFEPSGNVINLGKYEDVVYGHDTERKTSVYAGGNIFLDSDFQNAFDSVGLPAKFSYRFSVGLQGPESIYFKLNQGELEAEIETTRGNLTRNKFTFENGRGEFRLSNNNGLIPGVTVATSTEISDVRKHAVDMKFANGDVIKSLFENYFYIPSARTMDEYGLPIVNVYNNEIITSKGQRENMSRLVSYLSSSPPNVKNMISKWTYDLFGKKITTRTVPTYQQDKESTKVTIEFLEGDHYNSIINDGSGTNQVILLLTILGITPKRSILGIEEPEIYLHPKAQADLAKILIDVAINDEKQILFTTHSEHMLYPFLTNIASKKSLKPGDLGIFYFEKDNKTNSTKVTPLEVDEDGLVSGGLKGFFEAEIETLGEYMRALGHD